MSGTDGDWVSDENLPDDPEFGPSGERPERGLSLRERAAEAVGEIDAILSSDGPPDFDDILGPLFWPRVPASESTAAWAALRRWVDRLLERFPHVDHHVIPRCWWRHNGHVEALVALRDHERMCYDHSSSPTAAVEWHRAFRDIESRLREWTATLACGATHDPRAHAARVADEGEWTDFVAADSEERARNQPPPDPAINTDGTGAEHAEDHR